MTAQEWLIGALGLAVLALVVAVQRNRAWRRDAERQAAVLDAALEEAGKALVESQATTRRYRGMYRSARAELLQLRRQVNGSPLLPSAIDRLCAEAEAYANGEIH